jgi:hypothetical protein
MKPQYIFISSTGSKYYFSDKSLTIRHREDGPAIESVTGDKEWFVNGKYHREDGPAIEMTSGVKWWFRNGKKHREDGPACEYSSGTKCWFIDDIELTEAEFKAIKAPHNGKKVTVDGVEYTLKA